MRQQVRRCQTIGSGENGAGGRHRRVREQRVAVGDVAEGDRGRGQRCGSRGRSQWSRRRRPVDRVPLGCSRVGGGVMLVNKYYTLIYISKRMMYHIM